MSYGISVRLRNFVMWAVISFLTHIELLSDRVLPDMQRVKLHRSVSDCELILAPYP